MNLPLDYIVYDWLGDENYLDQILKTNKLPDKKYLKIKFERFLERVPVGAAQLALLTHNIQLDHSQSSLVALDEWLVDFLKTYEQTYRSEMKLRGIDYEGKDRFMSVGAIVTETTPELRSIFTDLTIYWGECLRIERPELVWDFYDGRKGTWNLTGTPMLRSSNRKLGVECGWFQGQLMTAIDWYRGGSNRTLTLIDTHDYCLSEYKLALRSFEGEV